jgi:hypothetical protein
MFRVLVLTAVMAGGSVLLGAAWHRAEASPRPILSSPDVAQSLVEETGWRRRWRRQQYAPIVVTPNPGVDVETDVDVEAGGPAVIVVPPPRPLSCGEYHYWNGSACVDARYNDPYLGPR